MAKNNQFVFRRLDTVGAADAEEDKTYLDNCFIDTGDLDVLLNCSDPRRIILGRTGSGKTALIEKLSQSEDRVIRVEPESLALSYISNSTILNFVAQLGVRLDIFFRLLWRHVFSVELIKRHFKIENAVAQVSFLEKVKAFFSEKSHVHALKYLERWGSTFWEETDYRIKELTTTLEKNLQASIGTKLPIGKVSIDAAHKLTAEEKAEVVARAQHVVNEVQIKELSEIMNMLDRALDDPQQRYYIVVDRLDEDWVDDRLRFRLIRALIETVRDFRHVRHAKLIVAIRVDLLDRIIRMTRDSGFQEEKYESLFLNLDWRKQDLAQLLDARVNFLVRQRYTKQAVKFADLVPASVDGEPPVDYMLSRTMMRPRDMILFFNQCIVQAADRPHITAEMIKRAEGEYSRARLRSLADEWHADYPNLLSFTDLLKRRNATFRLDDIPDQECSDLCLAVAASVPAAKDDLSAAAEQVVNELITPAEFRRIAIQVFYRIGLVGLKRQANESTTWSIDGRRSISQAEITDDVRVTIHPFARRTLGTTVGGSAH